MTTSFFGPINHNGICQSTFRHEQGKKDQERKKEQLNQHLVELDKLIEERIPIINEKDRLEKLLEETSKKLKKMNIEVQNITQKITTSTIQYREICRRVEENRNVLFGHVNYNLPYPVVKQALAELGAHVDLKYKVLATISQNLQNQITRDPITVTSPKEIESSSTLQSQSAIMNESLNQNSFKLPFIENDQVVPIVLKFSFFSQLLLKISSSDMSLLSIREIVLLCTKIYGHNFIACAVNETKKDILMENKGKLTQTVENSFLLGRINQELNNIDKVLEDYSQIGTMEMDHKAGLIIVCGNENPVSDQNYDLMLTAYFEQLLPRRCNQLSNIVNEYKQLPIEKRCLFTPTTVSFIINQEYTSPPPNQNPGVVSLRSEQRRWGTIPNQRQNSNEDSEIERYDLIYKYVKKISECIDRGYRQRMESLGYESRTPFTFESSLNSPRQGEIMEKPGSENYALKYKKVSNLIRTIPPYPFIHDDLFQQKLSPSLFMSNNDIPPPMLLDPKCRLCNRLFFDHPTNVSPTNTTVRRSFKFCKCDHLDICLECEILRWLFSFPTNIPDSNNFSSICTCGCSWQLFNLFCVIN